MVTYPADGSTGLLLPGQGSQFVGMGKGLAGAYPSAAAIFQEADRILGVALSQLCWEGPEEELVQTKHAQPAILAHSVAVARALGEGVEGAGVAAGHSLGEFTAHVLAGTLSFSDALRAVRVRGELMHEAGRERPVTMAALLGLGDEEAEAVCREASEGVEVCVPANFNAPGQVVVSGDVAAVERAEALARQAGARKAMRLNVSGAFHSPLMEPAEDGLRDFLKDLHFSDPVTPVISNVTARPVASGEDARELLVRQLTSPVRWAESVATMLEEGATAFLELGPGKVLCGLNRRNAREASCRAVGEETDLQELLGGE